VEQKSGRRGLDYSLEGPASTSALITGKTWMPTCVGMTNCLIAKGALVCAYDLYIV